MQNVRIEPFKLIGIAVHTTNENNQSAKDIAQLWQHFLGENIVTKIPNRIDGTVYSLYTDYEGDHTQPYTAILGCKVNALTDVPEGMTGKSFNGGNYIRISANGDLTKGFIFDYWQEIFKMKLERTYTADFEVFGDKAQNPTNAEVDFFVGIK